MKQSSEVPCRMASTALSCTDHFEKSCRPPAWSLTGSRCCPEHPSGSEHHKSNDDQQGPSSLSGTRFDVQHETGFRSSATLDDDLLQANTFTTESSVSDPEREDPSEQKECFVDKKYTASPDGTILHEPFPLSHPQIAVSHASPLPQSTIDALQHPIVKSFLGQLGTRYPGVQRVVFEFDPVENIDPVDTLSGDLDRVQLAEPSVESRSNSAHSA